MNEHRDVFAAAARDLVVDAEVVAGLGRDLGQSLEELCLVGADRDTLLEPSASLPLLSAIVADVGN